MKKKPDLMNEWFIKADHDLKAAESLLEIGFSPSYEEVKDAVEIAREIKDYIKNG